MYLTSLPPARPLPPFVFLSPMVGYCCKDSGRSHYKTFRKNVTKAEAHTALTAYCVLQRQNVKDNQVELGKKNFWPILMWFKQVRPVQHMLIYNIDAPCSSISSEYMYCKWVVAIFLCMAL